MFTEKNIPRMNTCFIHVTYQNKYIAILFKLKKDI